MKFISEPYMQSKMQAKKQTRLWQLGLFLCLIICAQLVQARPLIPESFMSVAPQKCVAMKQGNSCFVTVEVEWQLPNTGHYCLHSSQQKQEIECWDGKSQGRVELDIKALNNVTFIIRAKDGEQPLLSGLIKMAWVYKKKGKPRRSWRLF